jgi:hypothetical protein
MELNIVTEFKNNERIELCDKLNKIAKTAYDIACFNFINVKIIRSRKFNVCWRLSSKCFNASDVILFNKSIDVMTQSVLSFEFESINDVKLCTKSSLLLLLFVVIRRVVNHNNTVGR